MRDRLTRRCQVTSVLLVILWGVTQVHGITIAVDYTYDTHNFFDTQPKKEALQRAADRFSAIIVSPLLPVSRTDSTVGWRIGFTHPGTGQLFEISTAASADTDPIAPLSQPADAYGFEGLLADTWILYAGGRRQVSAGFGGTATGTNFTSTFDDFSGPFHRGLIPNTPSATANDLPVWGGSISFDTDTNWHFDTSTPAPLDTIDFYSIALHEIGHALGLNTSWNQWNQSVEGDTFHGAHAVAAYNGDNSANLGGLNLESVTDLHWEDGTYDSNIFKEGAPNYTGTVGPGNLQDLIMEPIANTSVSVRRFELTNVDVAALEDVGWSVVSLLDLDGDGVITGADLDVACSERHELTPWLTVLNSLPADADFDGRVQFSDFVILADHFAAAGSYTQGDFDCDGHVQFSDFVVLADSFGASPAAARTVPEPGGGACLMAWMLVAMRFRSRASLNREE
jgi:hypothetical protein